MHASSYPTSWIGSDIAALRTAQSQMGVGSTRFPYTVRTEYALKARFSATLGEEPEVELVLV
jgi:hypothetical protein